MKKNRILFSILSLLLSGEAVAQESATEILSLDSCRTLAMSNNKELRMQDAKQQAAYYERKAAYTKYFPRISATGAYMYTSKEISLLNGEQKSTLGNLGTTLGELVPQLDSKKAVLNSVGANLVEDLHTNTHHMGAVGVMLTQPIYMGGKIDAYNRITRYAEKVAARQHDLTQQEVILDVDKAYWQIVSLLSKKQLAESYLKLVEKLDSDVQQMIKEGIATKADGLSVRVKVNEAKVSLIQVNNGLSISKMLLCQLCGLDLNTPICLEDEGDGKQKTVPQPITANAQTAFDHRPELDMLSLAHQISQEKVKLARSAFMPTVALTGGYSATNPSVFNSFERKMKGMWNVGVMVNVPLVTFGERIYKVKAAKAEATMTALRLSETREKVELQVSQDQQKVEEAAERLTTAERSQAEADENLRYANAGMKEGVIPLSNVLEAQTAWLKAHSAQVEAEVDLRLANLYLLKSTGMLGLQPE